MIIFLNIYYFRSIVAFNKVEDDDKVFLPIQVR